MAFFYGDVESHCVADVSVWPPWCAKEAAENLGLSCCDCSYESYFTAVSRYRMSHVAVSILHFENVMAEQNNETEAFKLNWIPTHFTVEWMVRLCC